MVRRSSVAPAERRSGRRLLRQDSIVEVKSRRLNGVIDSKSGIERLDSGLLANLRLKLSRPWNNCSVVVMRSSRVEYA